MASEKSFPENAVEGKSKNVEYHNENNQAKAQFLLQVCQRLLVCAKAQRYMLTRPRSKKSSRIISIAYVAELKYLVVNLSNTVCISQKLIDQTVELLKKIARNERPCERKNPLTNGSTVSSTGFLKKTQPYCIELLTKAQSMIERLSSWQKLYEKKFQNEGTVQDPSSKAIVNRCKKMCSFLTKLSLYLHDIRNAENMVVTNNSS